MFIVQNKKLRKHCKRDVGIAVLKTPKVDVGKTDTEEVYNVYTSNLILTSCFTTQR